MWTGLQLRTAGSTRLYFICSAELERRPGDPAALADATLQRLVLASAAVSALSGPREMSEATSRAIDIAKQVTQTLLQ